MEYSLTILVPFFNKETLREKSVQRLIDTNLKIEKIILINDGSTDSSLNIASDIASKFSYVEVINNLLNQGKGSALSSAFSQVTTSHIAIHDADLEYNPKDFKEMIAKSKESKSSLILGSRFIGKRKRNNIYLRTYLANKFLSFLFSSDSIFSPHKYIQSSGLPFGHFSFHSAFACLLFASCSWRISQI